MTTSPFTGRRGTREAARGEADAALYAEIDADVDDLLGTEMGFDALLRASPYPMGEEQVAGFRDRYRAIKRFQEQATALFAASLRGDCDPGIAGAVVGELPSQLGVEYHRRLSDAQRLTPVFFRTDEPGPGKLSEVQCSGSGWGIAEQVHRLYARHPERFGKPRHFPEPLSRRFAVALRDYLGEQPRVHHLVDNASRPHDIRYFIQRTREHGLRYFSYDADVTPTSCNFVRSHDFVSLPFHNFFDDRMERCNRGEVSFDLPPSNLFDGKLVQAWPFWSATREHFGDDVRELFPHTALVTPEGVELEDGRRRVALAQLAEAPAGERDYYAKYAGSDIGINWGGKSVYLLSSMSRPRVEALVARVEADVARGRPWLLQRASRRSEETPVLGRNGALHEERTYTKLSGFYGPQGLMGILAMQKRFTKVHGGTDTIMSIVY